MFKTGSFEKELMEGMSKSLIGNQIENKYSFDKIAKVADYLNSAAEILDDTGMYAEAELVTRLLEKIANSKKKSKNDSKSRVSAMKRTGIPFLKSDMNHLDLDAEVHDFEDEELDSEDESNEDEGNEYQEDPYLGLDAFTKGFEETSKEDEEVNLDFDSVKSDYQGDAGDEDDIDEDEYYYPEN